MKKKKKIVIIFAVFCILLVSYFLVGQLLKNGDDQVEEGIELSKISAENITGFSYKHYNNEEYGEDVYSFIKEDGVWYYEADIEFPVNQRVINAKVQSVAAISADRVVEENPKDLSVYGLETPYLTVTSSDGKNDYTYHIGNYNESTTTYYLLEENTGVVYLADADLFVAFDMQIWDLLDDSEKDNLEQLDKDSFTRIKLEYPEETIDLLKSKTETDYVKAQWYLLDEASDIIKNTDTVSSGQFPGLIADITYLREVDYRCDQSEYEYYGFDEPSLIVTVDYVEGGEEKQFIMIIGNQTVENYIFEDYYVLTNQSEAVFTVEYSVIETLVSIKKSSLLLN